MSFKDLCWDLFKETGNPKYYMLYKAVNKNVAEEKDINAERDKSSGGNPRERGL